eukprot:2533024-Pyramimonas_sp.AAC.1
MPRTWACDGGYFIARATLRSSAPSQDHSAAVPRPRQRLPFRSCGGSLRSAVAAVSPGRQPWEGCRAWGVAAALPDN